jgi:hypothetical protein
MKYGLKKIKRVIINDIKTKKHKCTIVEIKSGSLAQGQEIVWLEGQDGSRLAGYDTTKTSTLNFESGVISVGVLETQTGGTLKAVTNGTGIKLREYLTAGTGGTSCTTTYLASGEAGKEILWIYPEDDTGDPDNANAYAQAGTASATEFSYAAATGVITLPTGKFAEGDTVIVDYYPTFDSYKELENNNSNFSFTGEVFVDCYMTDLSTQADVPAQIYCPAGRIGGAFDFSFGDTPAVQSVSIEALASQAAGKVGQMWVLRLYDLTEADTAS